MKLPKLTKLSSFFLCGVPLPTGLDSIPPMPPTTSSSSVPFPDASHIYGHGDGYLGSFFNDKYSHERASNPYYPFQSKGEWEIASFLSRSGLSMKRVDEFLSLSLVRQPDNNHVLFECADTTNRLLSSASRSIVPELYVAASNYCRVARLGNRQSSRFQGIQQRTPSCYITGTPSSALTSSSRTRSSLTTFNTLPGESTIQMGNGCTVNG